MEEEEEITKEAEELKKGDVEVLEDWKEWRSEKSIRMGVYIDKLEDSEMGDRGEEEESKEESRRKEKEKQRAEDKMDTDSDKRPEDCEEEDEE